VIFSLVAAGKGAPLGAEGKWTDDRFRFEGVAPALVVRVTVDAFALALMVVEEARFSLEVEEARFSFEIDRILIIS
jgi:hypothetical protein